MRSFNSNFNTEKNKRSDGPTPINLLTFNFATPVYISDRDITPSGGSPHKGLIKSWGFIDTRITRTPGAGILGTIDIADLQLVLINTESPRFSDNFTNNDPPENVTVELYQWFEGLTYGEKEPLFKGIIAGPPKYNLYECSLRIKGIWEKYNKLIGEDLIINADDYPSADPDCIGKMLPIGYGPLKKVPFMPVDAGNITTLAEDINSSVTTITVTNSSRFGSTGTIQIHAEQITYTGNSNNQFTGCIRGANSTTAVSHNKGSKIAEIQTNYFYIMGHAIKSFDAIYVADVRQTGGYTAYTGQSGDEHSGYPGKACIVFNTLPSLIMQIDLTAEDTIEVTSGADVTDTIYVVDGIIVSDNISIISQTSSTHHSADYDIGESFRCSGGAFNQQRSISNTGSDWAPQFDYTKSKNGYSQSWYFTIFIDDLGTNGYMKVEINNLGSGNYVDAFKIENGVITVPANIPYSFHHAADDYPETAGIIKVSADASWDGDVYVKLTDIVLIFYEYEMTTEKTGSASSTGTVQKKGTVGVDVIAEKTGTVTLSGNSIADIVIGGQVSADIQAYKDDGSGTYTGTPNALVERPDHVFKHAWSEILSASSGDVDTASFDTAGSFYAGNSYTFSLLITEPTLAEDLFMKLALQCRSRLLITAYGKVKLFVRELEQSSGQSILKNEIKRDSVSIERSAISDLINLFNIYYDKDHNKGGNNPDNYKAVRRFRDGTSIEKYGQQEWKGRSDLFLFDAVTSAAMVEDVGNFLRQYHSTVRKILRYGVFLDNLEIEPGDIIDVTHDLDSMAGFICEVLKTINHLGSARKKVIDHMEIIAVENRWGE